MGIVSKVAGFLTGNTGKAVAETAEGVANIVERWVPGARSKHDMMMEIQKFLGDSYASARAHDQPMNSGVKWVDAIVNAINRLIRPWVTITIIGSLFGYWELPPPESFDPTYWELGKIVLGFWFGGRLLVKDIPAGIKSLIK